MNIKKYRLEREINASSMAKKLNVGRKTYYNYENGKTEPTISTLIKICTILGITTDEALGFKSPERPKLRDEDLAVLQEAARVIEQLSPKKK